MLYIVSLWHTRRMRSKPASRLLPPTDDIQDPHSMGSVIVCGFYTEDYRRWLIPLVASLDRLGQAHDFVLAEKAGAMWETNTMAKARHILAAMDRHPDEVIVWLDVDCIVHGDLSPLADIRGDVAFRMHSKFRRHHKGARFRAQSGTMVFRPTPEARQFVEHWKRASERAPMARSTSRRRWWRWRSRSARRSFPCR